MDLLFPTEIISNILSYMSIKDLTKLERTSRLFQAFTLNEIENRIIKSGKDEWGILIHLGQVSAKPLRFDPKTKKTYYSILMDPVKIKTMFDHRRSVHCSLLKKNKTTKFQSFNEKGFIITVEKGMQEGKTLELNIKNEACQVHAALTRLPSSSVNTNDQALCGKQEIKKEIVQPIKSMAPAPLLYTLQITELSLPLSTIAA
ncbi:uncharacterized protein B0P05DRAFT_555400 [Gilbertella persicaria]|uniref:uncharacterized protein n=1 Tax=Gilbertella persicaria TaxID=101096 RepID=UPI00221F73E6|nr:uncharacterized protein B0P05DRAFT_555400 [Gilbertella persicaria]KAI8063715.1 hypothetical protein B0P05DRAFT_555400 [Gilbertella persicaria]